MLRKNKILIVIIAALVILAVLAIRNFIHMRNASAHNSLIDDLRQTNSN